MVCQVLNESLLRLCRDDEFEALVDEIVDYLKRVEEANLRKVNVVAQVVSIHLIRWFMLCLCSAGAALCDGAVVEGRGRDRVRWRLERLQQR